MTNFCTLFDHNYLSRGLVMYESLKANCSDKFKLYILTTDDIAFKWFCDNPQENIIVNSLAEIKKSYPVLSRLENERTRTEFNWTLSSFSIQFFLKKYKLPSITYLDADLRFYADPNSIFEGLKKESVIITPHNYTPSYDQSATSGRYCVQFMHFKNDKSGNEVLEWWRNECEKCCCGAPTDGKFGDQKYLDDWLSRFEGKIHEENRIGCGVAPWNIQKFDLKINGNGFSVCDKITKVTDKLIFFHFHGLKEMQSKDGIILWKLNKYDYPDFVIKNLYEPYTKHLEQLAPTLPPISYSPYTVPKQISFTRLIYKTIRRSLKFFVNSFLILKTFKVIKREAQSERDQELRLVLTNAEQANCQRAY